MARPRSHARLRDLDPELRALVRQLVFARGWAGRRAALRRIRTFLANPLDRTRRLQLLDTLLRLVSHRRELCPRLEQELCQYVAEHNVPIEFRERVAQLGLTGHRRPFQNATLGLLRNSDNGAWNTLYSLLSDKARGAARRFTPSDPQMVEEVAHEASVRFYEHVQRNDGDLEKYVRGFAPLMAAITRNQFLDLQEQRSKMRSLPDGDLSEDLFRRDIKRDLDRADSLVEQLGVGDLVDMVRAETDDSQWFEIANLAVVRGLSLSRIATALGTNKSTVKSQWVRGREAIRQRLAPLMDDR